ncbi:MAG: polyketide synthase dehydratase domain-containing protein [Myxococcales bacterium]|nr:polyketide synthase dehydratase domain-containing protein [Myxococcales bacterium]
MTALGLDYGPAFRTVRALHRGPGHVLGRVAVDALAGIDRHHLHPALLDGCFQLAVHLGDDTTSRLPAGVDRIAFTGRRTAAVWCHLTPAPSADPALLRVDLRLYDDDGAPVAAIDGLTLRALDAGPASERPAAELMHTLDWIPEPAPPPAPAPLGRWLVVAEPALAAALAAGLHARDAAVVTASPSSLDDPEALAAALRDVTAGPDWRGVVFSRPAQPPTRRRRRRRHLVALLRAISRQDASARPPLDPHPRPPLADAPPTPDLGLGAAIAWGIARVAALELSPLWGGVIDAPPPKPPPPRSSPSSAPPPSRPCTARRPPRAPLRSAPPPPSPPSPRGATLITGGLASVSLAIARALVDRSARRLLLAGRTRSPRATGARSPATRRRPRRRHPRPRSPRRLIHPSPSTSPTPPRSPPRSPTTTPSATPIRAVIHSAGVLRDAMLMRIADGDLDAVLRPKLAGGPPRRLLPSRPSTASCSSPPSPPSSPRQPDRLRRRQRRPRRPRPRAPRRASPPPPSAGAPGARPACSAASTPARPAPSPAP